MEASVLKLNILKTYERVNRIIRWKEAKGLRRQPVGDFKRNWRTASINAGIPARIFHDFRRTAVHNLARAGVPERVAMIMTGHKTRSVFERYNIVSKSDLDEASKRLGEYLKHNKMKKDTGKVRVFSEKGQKS